MTAKKLLIYACGGGNGHLVRAINYANSVANNSDAKKYKKIEILTYKKSTKFAPNFDQNTSLLFTDWSTLYSSKNGPSKSWKEYDLVVDTFPLGHHEEIYPNQLSTFNSKKLIARYSKDLKHLPLHTLYDDVLLPYSEIDEWDSKITGTKIGLLTRQEPCRIINDHSAYAIVDPSQKIPTHLVKKISDFCMNKGKELNYYPKFSNAILGEKVLVIGAGYNTFYELYGQSKHLRFFPLAKKYDDQFNRVDLHRCGIKNLSEILSWFDKE